MLAVLLTATGEGSMKFWKEAIKLCYLIAKHCDKPGCIALKTIHGKHLAQLKRRIISEVGYELIELVTLSRPSAYVEYEPYRFVQTEEEFAEAVKKLLQE